MRLPGLGASTNPAHSNTFVLGRSSSPPWPPSAVKLGREKVQAQLCQQGSGLCLRQGRQAHLCLSSPAKLPLVNPPCPALQRQPHSLEL